MATAPAQPVDTRTSAGSGKVSVLVVEDDPDDQDWEAEMILCAFPDARVHVVGTGAAALSQIEHGPTDCVVLDHNLGPEDGMEILTDILTTAPHLPVIMMTGQGDEDLAATAIKRGASDYLVKQTLTETSLKTAIDNAVTHAALSARLADQEAERRVFLKTLAHDLRAPLHNIHHLGQAALKAADAGRMDEAHRLMQSETAVAARAARLIETLEVYALLDGAVSFAPTPLSDAAAAARENLAPLIAERGGVVRIGALPVVEGCMPQLIQLLQNLIANGLKYNASKRPTVEVISQPPRLVTVRDNGIGVPQAHREEIFAPLKRLRNQSDSAGAGLGLAICRWVAEQHRAKIWCEPNPGGGSAFHIRFPDGP